MVVEARVTAMMAIVALRVTVDTVEVAMTARQGVAEARAVEAATEKAKVQEVIVRVSLMAALMGAVVVAAVRSPRACRCSLCVGARRFECACRRGAATRRPKKGTPPISDRAIVCTRQCGDHPNTPHTPTVRQQYGRCYECTRCGSVVCSTSRQSLRLERAERSTEEPHTPAHQMHMRDRAPC